MGAQLPEAKADRNVISQNIPRSIRWEKIQRISHLSDIGMFFPRRTQCEWHGREFRVPGRASPEGNCN